MAQPPSNKIIFESHCGDECYEDIGARKLKNSLAHFHPDIELHIFGDAEIAEFKKTYPWLGWANMDPILCGKLAEDHDLVIHIDADSIVTGKLVDVLSADFDIAGVRNNNDAGMASGLGATFGTHIPGIDARWQYLNAGLVASTSKEFWKDFLHHNEHDAATGFGEQDVWNRLFWSGKYKAKLLDPKESNVYYGVAQQLPRPGQPMQDAWRQMYMKDGSLYFKDKIVKIIHNAGGFGLPKLQYQNWVEPDVKEFLDHITN